MSPEDAYHQSLFDDTSVPENLYIPKKQSEIRQAPNQQRHQAAKQQHVLPPPPQEEPECKILLKKGSKLNKKLIEFFKTHLEFLNHNGFLFEWIAVYEDEIDFYEEQGIDKFPALIADNNNIYGVKNIMDSISQIISKINEVNYQNNQQSKQSQRSTPAKKYDNMEEGEELNDYMMNMLKSQDKEGDDDDADSAANNLHKRTMAMTKARSDGGLHTVNNDGPADKPEEDIFGRKTNANKARVNRASRPIAQRPEAAGTSVMDILKVTKRNDPDDDLMTKFYENMEETVL